MATVVVTPGDDFLFDIDDFGDFYYNFDDTVLDELDSDTSTSIVAQATSQLGDDTPLAPAHSKAQERTSKGLNGQAGTQEEAETHRGQGSSGRRLCRCCLKAQKHDIPWLYSLV